ncbi:hypothetical protein EJD97_003913 [Solanum chilense]|uniref:Uncharacterized protein n=1 Tax=Solanum chilense TaxID=4083 RepID=A0A6N2AK47_SOLCI|nr:hypothetical protein EJD97_003913 [Solanum chilense]
MDASSPSMRFTTDMSLYVNIVDKLSSFPIGLTQDFGVNVALWQNPNKFKMNINGRIEIQEKIKMQCKGETKRKAITSESEVSEPEIDRSEEHQDHQVPA